MENDLIIGKGKLVFDPEHRTNKHFKQGSWKRSAMIVIDDDTYKYYQWLIEREYPFIQGVKGDTKWINPPLRGTHVTILNDRVNGSNIENWEKMKEKYDGQEVHFFFNWDGLRNTGKHIYFKVECPLGQMVRDFGNFGEPYFGFHLTVGLVPNESIVKKEHNENVRKSMIYKQ